MFRAIRAMLRDPEGKALVIATVSIIALGTIVYMVLEHWSPVDALYFSVVTLATVGFGDLHPTTAAAKLFTVLYILSGLGIIAAFVSELMKYRPAPGPRLTRRDTSERDDVPAGDMVAGDVPAAEEDERGGRP